MRLCGDGGRQRAITCRRPPGVRQLQMMAKSNYWRGRAKRCMSPEPAPKCTLPPLCCRVLDRHALVGLHPRFAALLAPLLRGRPGGARILDLASASGEPAVTLAAALPDAQVVSTDLAPPFLELGRARAAAAGLTNVEFQTAGEQRMKSAFRRLQLSFWCCLHRP